MLGIAGTEVVGYAASALVVLALTRTSVVRLRLLSLAGSITFVIYGALIGSVPILITNASIALINIWFLRKEFAVGSAAGFDLGVSIIRADSPFLEAFIDYHLDDIRSFQPHFSMPSTDPRFGDEVFVALLTRDAAPAGLIVGRRTGERLRIDLDYVLAEYRDSRLGVWLYGTGADVFRRAGLTRLITDASTPTHANYLRRIGFDERGDSFELDL